MLVVWGIALRNRNKKVKEEECDRMKQCVVVESKQRPLLIRFEAYLRKALPKVYMHIKQLMAVEILAWRVGKNT